MAYRQIPMRAAHYNDVMRLLDNAAKYGQEVNIRCYKASAHGTGIADYRGARVVGGYWRGGWHRIKLPNGEMRTLPDCYIISVNNLKMYF